MNQLAQRVVRFSEVFTLVIILLYILILWPGRTDSFWFSTASLVLFTLATIIAFVIIIASFLQQERFALQAMLAFFIVSIILSAYAYWWNGIVDPLFLAVLVLAIIGATASCGELRMLSKGHLFTKPQQESTPRVEKAEREAEKEMSEDKATSAKREKKTSAKRSARKTSGKTSAKKRAGAQKSTAKKTAKQEKTSTAKKAAKQTQKRSVKRSAGKKSGKK